MRARVDSALTLDARDVPVNEKIPLSLERTAWPPIWSVA